MNVLKTRILVALLGTTVANLNANISIQSSSGILESLEVENSITFTLTAAIDDTSFLVVLNDVYQNDTFLPNEDFTPSIVSEPKATVNGTDESAFTFAWLVRESQWESFGPFNSGYDPRDLSIVYYFGGSGISADIGDTITLELGTILKQTGLDIPELDNLGGAVAAHLVAASFDQRITNDQLIAIVPEVSHAAPAGMLCLALCGLHFSSRKRVHLKRNQNK